MAASTALFQHCAGKGDFDLTTPRLFWATSLPQAMPSASWLFTLQQSSLAAASSECHERTSRFLVCCSLSFSSLPNVSLKFIPATGEKGGHVARRNQLTDANVFFSASFGIRPLSFCICVFLVLSSETEPSGGSDQILKLFWFCFGQSHFDHQRGIAANSEHDPAGCFKPGPGRWVEVIEELQLQLRATLVCLYQALRGGGRRFACALKLRKASKRKKKKRLCSLHVRL